MKKKEIAKTGGPDRLAKQLYQRRPKHEEREAHHHGGGSIRHDEYAGRKIEIRTAYEVTIDGKKFEGHLGVGDDGRVHCHSIPTYSSGSMVDLVRQLIDNFPDDFPKPPKKKRKTSKYKSKSKRRSAHKGVH